MHDLHGKEEYNDNENYNENIYYDSILPPGLYDKFFDENEGISSTINKFRELDNQLIAEVIFLKQSKAFNELNNRKLMNCMLNERACDKYLFRLENFFTKLLMKCNTKFELFSLIAKYINIANIALKQNNITLFSDIHRTFSKYIGATNLPQ